MTEAARLVPEDVFVRLLFFGGFLFLCLVLAIFFLVARWRLFKKADEPGWACLVPLYRNYVFYKIAFGNGWLFLLLLVPFVNIYFAYALPFKLAKAFGHGVGYGIGLLFFSNTFIMLIAFGKSRYIGSHA